MTVDSPFSTPMMQQYLQLKEQYPDCLLFFRLGDFYELFLDDALIGSQVLGITLTSRTRGKDGRIPMAGVPYHAVEGYLAKLLAAGHKVAICEQLTPATSGKTLVDRQVIRVLTPGTVTTEQLLTSHDHNYLLAVELLPQSLQAAVVDLSTGELRAGTISLKTDSLATKLTQLISQFQPQECVLAAAENPATTQLLEQLRSFDRLTISRHHPWPATPASSKKIVAQTVPHLVAASPTSSIALAGLLSYLHYTQKTALLHLTQVLPLFETSFLQLDQTAITNLELLETLRPQQQQGSLLGVLNHTKTAAGARLLKHWLLRPLLNIEQLNQRLDAVEFWLTQHTARHQLREQATRIGDLERQLSRLSVATGTPRDLRSVGDSLLAAQELLTSLPPAYTKLTGQSSQLPPTPLNLATTITSQLVEQPPIDPKQGGLIKAGHLPELDQLRQTIAHHRQCLSDLELKERQASGISTLKIRYNSVFGFYIEISKANLHLAPDHYHRLQTLVNAERFTTPELKSHEDAILQAESELATREYQLFQNLVAAVLALAQPLQQVAYQLAELDCLTNLAEVAEQYHYVRPRFNDQNMIEIIDGRHPVLEKLAPAATTKAFVPNTVRLGGPNQPQILLITGPNMAGKSVLMRQVALITLLAQLGSFVPAAAANVSITDRIFVRSGAADMITAGLSTFMVEMVETASILHSATPASLIIMDEIGRGTSTYDGISLAWAIAEYLVANPTHAGKTLFATHYHELQELAERWPGKIANAHLAVTQHQGKLVFLYQLTAGGSAHSHGLAVAELAGLPSSVISQARQLLQKLEHQHAASPPIKAGAGAATTPNQLEQDLRKLDLSQLTPLAALNLLAAWQQQLPRSAA